MNNRRTTWLILVSLMLSLSCFRSSPLWQQQALAREAGSSQNDPALSSIHPLIYSSYLGGDRPVWATALAVDDRGCAYIAGSTSTHSPDRFHVTRDNPGFQKNFPSLPRRSTETAGFILKLDPSGTKILFSTWIGGYEKDSITSIAVDKAYNVYITGWTESSEQDAFPIGSKIQGFDSSFNGKTDVFVMKLDPTGSKLLYSTYIGGSGQDSSVKIAVNEKGEAFVSGKTDSSDFPWTTSPFNKHKGSTDAFLVRLNAEGTDFTYSIALGGEKADEAVDLAIDSNDNAYLAGTTRSSPGEGFPIGGSIPGVFTHRQANDPLSDAFFIKVNPSGSEVLYSSYIGGKKDDLATALALSVSGHVYLAGRTQSSPNLGFPIGQGVPGLEQKFRGDNKTYDGFVVKLDLDSNKLLFSTYIGGSKDDFVNAIALDQEENLLIVGHTFSSPEDHFPMTPSNPGFYKTYKRDRDVFLLKLSKEGTEIHYSSYFGGYGDDYLYAMVQDDQGYVYLQGYTRSSVKCGFPAGKSVPGLQQYSKRWDGYITKLSIPLVRIPESINSSSPLLKIENIGNGTLRGTLDSSSPWLSFSKEFIESNEEEIELKFESTNFAPGEYHSMIQLYSNAGTYHIPVTLSLIATEESPGLQINLQQPSAFFETTDDKILVKGKISGNFDPASLSINGSSVTTISPQGSFEHTVPLFLGANHIVLSAKNPQGFSYSKTLKILRTEVKPSREITIEMWYHQTTAYVNGEPRIADAPGTIVAGRSMLPLRFISESFGGIVTYDDIHRSAKIQYESYYGPVNMEVFLETGQIIIDEESYDYLLLFVSNGRIMIYPIFFVVGFNAHVIYEAKERKWILSTSDSHSCDY
ncbi:MAG TPA: SBBP repeat-containing protein [Caldisericia bacterium]|nr:SBBP repeat-containing protein [Caldisericia bacterium]